MANPDASLTPEKRLLDLIEEPDAHKADVAAGAEKARRSGLFSPTALKEKFAANTAATVRWVQASFGIKDLNRILKIVVVVLAVVFLVMLVIDVMALRRDIVGSIKVPDSQALEMAPVTDAPKGAVAVENWDLNKMFIPYGKRIEAEKQVQDQSVRLVDMIKNLRLTGISLNPKDPQLAFCMIEDIEKGITTFLREGDPVNMLRVQKIAEDRVVLALGDETVELH